MEFYGYQPSGKPRDEEILALSQEIKNLKESYRELANKQSLFLGFMNVVQHEYAQAVGNSSDQQRSRYLKGVHDGLFIAQQQFANIINDQF